MKVTKERYRVIRGKGSSWGGRKNGRARREKEIPKDGYNDLGFRIVLGVKK